MSTQVNLKGRLSSDPELRFTASGKALVRITVVTSRNRKTDEGWKEEDTTFWDVTLWEQDAEAVADSLLKGDQVSVMGAAYSRSWEDPNGEKRSRVEVRGRTVAAIVDRRQRVKTNRVQRTPVEHIEKENDPWATPAPLVESSIDDLPF
jgi:single-strand DNA-binding protein